MFRRRVYQTIAYNYDLQSLKCYANVILIETQPPFCHVCNNYLTDLECKGSNKSNCPYYEYTLSENKIKK